MMLVPKNRGARGGEEFNPTLLAPYQDLVAQEAREQGINSTTLFVRWDPWISIDFRFFWLCGLVSSFSMLTISFL
jgi:hypothetical protein